MCGYAGFIIKSDRLINTETMGEMLNAILRRGPDSHQVMHLSLDGAIKEYPSKIMLMHTRLAIRDLTVVANQPMYKDGVWICYNGEVYDWEADAKRLQAQGIPFCSTSDTEYILNAYLAYGMEGLLPRLRGMFSFCILDLNKQELYLARDRFGVKPLFYHLDEDTGDIAFGSLVRSILPFLPRNKRSFSANAIDAYFAHRYIPSPHTIFTNISRLESGHYICHNMQNGCTKKVKYWHPTPNNKQEWVGELDYAIKLRMASDRPVGIFLSGGLDSNLIANRLAKLGFEELTCFTARFSDTDYDESIIAKKMAAQIGYSLIPIDMPSKISIDDFNRIISDLDEPFADPSAIPMWFLARETRNHVPVILGGDGGDEIFAGYKRYRKHLRTSFRQNFYVPSIKNTLPFLNCNNRFSRIIEELGSSWQDAYAMRFSGFNHLERKKIMPDFYSLSDHWYGKESLKVLGNTIDYLLEIDRHNYLPEYVLRKADLCTMSHGLELRSPLLDHHLFQNTIGLDEKIRFTTPPKQLFASISPQLACLIKNKKMGFNLPLTPMLLNIIRGSQLNFGAILQDLTQGQISQKAINNIINAFLFGGQHLGEKVLQILILTESLSQLSSLSQK